MWQTSVCSNTLINIQSANGWDVINRNEEFSRYNLWVFSFCGFALTLVLLFPCKEVVLLQIYVEYLVCSSNKPSACKENHVKIAQPDKHVNMHHVLIPAACRSF